MASLAAREPAASNRAGCRPLGPWHRRHWSPITRQTCFARAARKLNHFGGVAISDESVEFDGDDVRWSDITEIRTRSLIEYLFTGGVDKQADKLPLPWFPGRGLLINAISRAALTLLLAAAKQELEGGALKIRIPAEVQLSRAAARAANCPPACWPRCMLADPAVRNARGDRASARHHDRSRRGRRDGGRRRAGRADQVGAGVGSGEDRRTPLRRRPGRRRARRAGASRRADPEVDRPSIVGQFGVRRRRPRRGPPSSRPARAVRPRHRRRTGRTPR